MIDVHFHCLPGVDDGPRTWDEAVALCRAAAEDGTTTIVATPHVLRGRWRNTDPRARGELVDALNARLGGSPRVVPGCEILYSDEILALARDGPDGTLSGLAGGSYLLVEFDPGPIPASTVAAFHELRVLGLRPLVAHPERHPVFAREPERLVDLVARGARVQITAASVLGEFGRSAKKACEEFWKRGLVHAVASDAHTMARRPPRLAAARDWVRRTWGEEAALGLFVHNPEAIVASQPLSFP